LGRKYPNNQGLIFIISGPSGSGKTTLLNRLLRVPELRYRLGKSVSLTTRPRRSKEKEGRDYFFISQRRFLELRRSKKILEWTKYLGYYYATPKVFIESQFKKGRHPALCLDFKGAQKIKRLYPENTVTIFVMPPSLGALRGRIRKRCHKTAEGEIQRRVELAKRELLVARQYDYCLINRNLKQAAQQLKKVILTILLKP